MLAGCHRSCCLQSLPLPIEYIIFLLRSAYGAINAYAHVYHAQHKTHCSCPACKRHALPAAQLTPCQIAIAAAQHLPNMHIITTLPWYQNKQLHMPDEALCVMCRRGPSGGSSMSCGGMVLMQSNELNEGTHAAHISYWLEYKTAMRLAGWHLHVIIELFVWPEGCHGQAPQMPKCVPKPMCTICQHACCVSLLVAHCICL